MPTLHLTPTELALFAELLDPLSSNREMALLRDRIETFLYVSGYYDAPSKFHDYDYPHEYIEGNDWRNGEYHVWNGLYDAYGPTLDDAIDELHRNMGVKR